MLKKFFDQTFWKFIIVGVVNTIFGTGIMFLFYNLLHLNYWISSASNYFFGSILSYILNKTFTFQSRGNTPATILRFAANITICYLCAYGLAKPLIRWALAGTSSVIQDNVAMLAGMCLFVAFNYCGQRFFVFRERSKGERKNG